MNNKKVFFKISCFKPLLDMMSVLVGVPALLSRA